MIDEFYNMIKIKQCLFNIINVLNQGIITNLCIVKQAKDMNKSKGRNILYLVVAYIWIL